AGPARFPDVLDIAGNRLPLEYAFAPGAANDGLTLLVPAPVLGELDAGSLAWLVPGLREEKIAALLRALPKALRKQLVPVPDHARAALADFAAAADAASAETASDRLPRTDFFERMARWIASRAGAQVSAAELAVLPLPDPLRLNIRVLAVPAESAGDAQRLPILAEGRDLAAIRTQLGGAAVTGRAVGHLGAAEGRSDATRLGDATSLGEMLHRQWDFGELPEVQLVSRAGMRYRVHPAIEDRGRGVARIEATSAAEADVRSRAAVVRLAEIALPQQARDLRRRIGEDRELVLLVQGMTLDRPLPDAVADRAFAECLLPDGAPLPRTRAAFESLIDARRAGLYAAAERTADEVRSALAARRQVRAARDRRLAFGSAIADIDGQLASLLPPDFIASTPEPWLAQLPRYLEAMARRLERLPGGERRDAELARRVAPFAAAWERFAHERRAALPAVQRFRWMVEEFRVSLFAQDLGTRMAVSEKRLAAELDALR
ncbi:MAG: DUF3418 domain-containing protein, partial [Steroidobacteraceae bacterium]